uniref:Uncharacterized protein n=1 Tax=Rhizophora mucronata TaxID=61149 RepID=A0A2P2QZ48_RHIMU
MCYLQESVLFYYLFTSQVM